MTSVETQVSVTDPEGIVGVIRSLYSQLQELQEFNKSLIQDRQDLVQTSEDIGTRLSERVTDLLNTAESMERVISEDSAAITSTDTELQDLLNEKGDTFTLWHIN
jgi:DNA anti-recombination protein RmuC